MKTMFTPQPSLDQTLFLQGNTNTSIPSNDTLWLVVNSTDQGLSQVEQFTDFLKRVWEIEESRFINIHITLSEAVMNAFDHGNKWEEGKSIRICAKRDEEYYGFLVEDEGEGFNYRRIENPTDRENREKSHGRGIFIMNYLTDNLHYSENGKCVNLLFSRT